MKVPAHARTHRGTSARPLLFFLSPFAQRIEKVTGNSSLVREWAYTARQFSPEEAQQCGLVSRVFDDREAMMAEVDGLFLSLYLSHVCSLFHVCVCVRARVYVLVFGHSFTFLLAGSQAW